ncbi:hypothetical protein HMPREF0083_02801 [Aneurinibacillus aneurinilyticus ATCC 12856]|uniref:Uncharacterized protein n=1 Tax=Aneurinibacillus aneurinilyticus ATCC 12856 TaxID=649747 RepID=U1YE92_ANEAE|nr:hypothetical protein HMPREF0083_02801 [Aneurinibacillus aneurinilyticus ATCC 12856]
MDRSKKKGGLGSGKRLLVCIQSLLSPALPPRTMLQRIFMPLLTKSNDYWRR